MCKIKKIFGKIANYFLGVKKEIGRIRWTKPKELAKYTASTLVFMIFFGAFFTIIDLAVSYLRSL